MRDDPGKKQMLLAGGGFARIYAPDGQPMHATLPEDQEGMVFADIDLGMISLAKAAADPAGHYARPDVTRLLLNKTRGDRVVLRATPRSERGVDDDRGSTPRRRSQPSAAAAARGLRSRRWNRPSPSTCNARARGTRRVRRRLRAALSVVRRAPRASA